MIYECWAGKVSIIDHPLFREGEQQMNSDTKDILTAFITWLYEQEQYIEENQKDTLIDHMIPKYIAYCQEEEL